MIKSFFGASLNRRLFLTDLGTFKYSRMSFSTVYWCLETCDTFRKTPNA